MKSKITLLLIVVVVGISAFAGGKVDSPELNQPKESPGFKDASSFGFSPEATGMENSIAMQTMNHRFKYTSTCI